MKVQYIKLGLKCLFQIQIANSVVKNLAKICGAKILNETAILQISVNLNCGCD